jgi:ribosomal protein S18 acetylase RimI-like enzyme
MSVRIRPSESTDVPFLRQMLYEAAYWRGDIRPDFEAGLSTPEFRKLLADWGRDGDLAVVAEDASQPVGAAWLRFWDDQDHSFGYVSSDVPELGIGVVETYRNMGIGRRLMERLLSDVARAGTERVSLSVERDNPALHLYETLGFKVVGTVGNAYTMVASAGAA